MNILRLTTPYKDIYTTVCLVRTDAGALLFDAASWDTDAEEYILPFLREAGIGKDELKYIFISHDHTDHSGGLKGLLPHFPSACIVSAEPGLASKHPQANVALAQDGMMLLDVLKVVHIPGHTMGSAGLLDTRTGTLLSGDCLQLYGIYGSGKWGANIRWILEHLAAIERLRGENIENILAAHDYHPYGYYYEGKEAVEKALTACVEPFERVKELIAQHPHLNDEEICAKYNELGLPTLGTHVVTAVRTADI